MYLLEGNGKPALLPLGRLVDSQNRESMLAGVFSNTDGQSSFQLRE